MGQFGVGQETKQSTMDLLGWIGQADVPEFGRARMYYDFSDNTVHAIDSDGTQLLLGDGTALSLFPVTDQVISGAFGVILGPGGYLQTIAVTFDELPAASPSNEGTLRPVTDSMTASWGATITGGGSNHVLGYSNGTDWTVAAK